MTPALGKGLHVTGTLVLTALFCVHVAAQPFALGRAASKIDQTAVTDDKEPGEPRSVVPEFPPGLFTDGGRYRLNDLDGKVVVLLFYDGADSRFAATAANRAAVVRLFAGRPVAFFGVQAATVDQAREDASRLALPMPVFADNLGVLGLRYGVVLTPAKSWRVVIIGPRGEVRHGDMLPDVIEAELKSARWSYREHLSPVDAKLEAAIDSLECGDYHAAARQINAVAQRMDAEAATSLAVGASRRGAGLEGRGRPTGYYCSAASGLAMSGAVANSAQRTYRSYAAPRPNRVNTHFTDSSRRSPVITTAVPSGWRCWRCC